MVNIENTKMKQQTEIQLIVETNGSNEIDEYIKSHIKYIEKQLVRRSLGKLESAIEKIHTFSDVTNKITFGPSNNEFSPKFNSYQILIEWNENAELNVKASYVKEHFSTIKKAIHYPDIKAVKNVFDMMNS